jgi:hypothetical protein
MALAMSSMALLQPAAVLRQPDHLTAKAIVFRAPVRANHARNSTPLCGIHAAEIFCLESVLNDRMVFNVYSRMSTARPPRATHEKRRPRQPVESRSVKRKGKR